MADALQTLELAVARLASALGSIYIDLIRLITTLDSESASSQSRRGPRRYLFPTGTLAAGVWRPGDDIHLVCLTEDRVAIFWDIVCEALEMDDFKTPKDGVLKLEAFPQELEKLARPGVDVSLHYSPLPENFDLTLLKDYGLSNPKNHPQVARISKSVSLISALQGHFPRFQEDYLRVHRWAHSMGLLGPTVGLCSSHDILSIVHHTYVEWTQAQSTQSEGQGPVKSSFLDYFFSSSPLESIRTAVDFDRSSQQAYVALQDATDCVRSASRIDDALDITIAEGHHIFLAQYDHFVVITAECHETQAQRQLPEMLSKIVKDVVYQIGENVNARVWPEMLDSSYIIGIKGASVPQLPDPKSPKGTIITLSQCTLAEIEDLFPFPYQTSSITPSQPVKARAEGAKFRPASSALARLRWDPAHSGTAYEVGYLDRFDGLIWTALEKWGGKATEEEDFIPEHRVKQIRREDDKKLVWDREGRIDLTG